MDREPLLRHYFDSLHDCSLRRAPADYACRGGGISERLDEAVGIYSLKFAEPLLRHLRPGFRRIGGKASLIVLYSHRCVHPTASGYRHGRDSSLCHLETPVRRQCLLIRSQAALQRHSADFKSGHCLKSMRESEVRLETV